MQRIVIIGSNGQLGTDLCKIFESKKRRYAVFKITHKDLDISDLKKTVSVLNKIQPSIVINTAAFHKVESVEDDPEKAFLINSIAVRNLANYCKDNSKTYVWFSTDYVFGGDLLRNKPYREYDTPSPLNTYGISKLAGEHFIKFINPRHFIIRSCGLFGKTGSSGKGGNFVETMLKLSREKKEIRVVNDQVMSPTFTYNLASQVEKLLCTNKYGMYHATSEGCCSWYEFAKEIFRQTRRKVKVKPVSSLDFPSSVRRPSYSVLENHRLKKNGLNIMKNWKEALSQYLEIRG